MSRILLLLDHRGNRQLLIEALSPRYEVIVAESDNFLDSAFDLGIVDGIALDRLWDRIQTRKKAELPAFLPFLFVTARQDIGMATRHLWKSIDELILSPIEKIELQARIEMLLQTRRLSCEFYYTMIQASPLAIILLDRDGRVQQWNPSAERIFGWSKEEVLEHPLPIFSGEGQDNARIILEQCLHGDLFINLEMHVKKKDDTFIDIQFSAAPLRDATGMVTHVVCLVSDITEHKQTEKEAMHRLAELEAIYHISTALRTAQTLDEMLPILLDKTLSVFHTDTGSIWLYNAEQNKLTASVSRGWFKQIIEIPSITKEEIAGWVFSNNEPYITREFASDTRICESARAQVPTGWGGICIPIRAMNQIIGMLFVAVKLPREIQSDEIHLLTTLAEMAGNAIHRTRLHEDVLRYAAELEAAYDSTIEGWSRALELRDRETEGHTLRVTEITLRLARAMGMNENELVHLRRGALLHDIGKMGVPDSILLKPDKLTDEERKIMQQHPKLAYEMLASIKYLQPALDIPYCHHEKWDGSGYPRGLKGKEIPLAARIFAVVDVWDALMSDRPYRPAWPKDKVIQYIREQAGIHFDPEVVEHFLQLIDNNK